MAPRDGLDVGEEKKNSLSFVNNIFNILQTYRINENERNTWITLNLTVLFAIFSSPTGVTVEDRRRICLCMKQVNISLELRHCYTILFVSSTSCV